MFTVNHNIVCAPCSSQLEIASHELQYCQDRVQLYHVSKNQLSVCVDDPSGSDVVANQISIVDDLPDHSIVPDQCIRNVPDQLIRTVPDHSIVPDQCIRNVPDQCIRKVPDHSIVPDQCIRKAPDHSIVPDQCIRMGPDHCIVPAQNFHVDQSCIHSVPDHTLGSDINSAGGSVESGSDLILHDDQGVEVYIAGIQTVSYLNAKATEWVPEEACNPTTELCSLVSASSACDGGIAQPAQNFHVKEKSLLKAVELFVESQSMGSVVEPRCGGCKCGKCPIHGQKYSFHEQQEHDIIDNNLRHVEIDGKTRWITELPWKCPRNTLPRNEKAAHQNLCSLRRSLEKKPGLGGEYDEQVDDMLNRRAAIILSEKQSFSPDRVQHTC